MPTLVGARGPALARVSQTSSVLKQPTRWASLLTQRHSARAPRLTASSKAPEAGTCHEAEPGELSGFIEAGPAGRDEGSAGAPAGGTSGSPGGRAGPVGVSNDVGGFTGR